MEKLFTIIVSLMLLMSMGSFVLAERDDANQPGLGSGSTTDGTNPGVDDAGEGNTQAADTHLQNALAIKQQRIENLAVKHKERYENLEAKHKERFKNLNDRMFTKVIELEQTQMEKLGELNPEQIRKVANVQETAIKKFANLEESQLKKLANLDRTKLKQLGEMTETQIREHLDDYKIKQVTKENLFKARVIAKEKIEEKNHEFVQATNHYKQAKEEYKEQKKVFVEHAREAKACGEDSEECAAMKEEHLEKSRRIVVDSADRAIEYMNKILLKLQSAENLAEDEIVPRVENINNAISKLEEAKTMDSEGETIEQVREAGQMVKRVMNAIQHQVKSHAVRTIHNSAITALKRADHLQERLEKAFAKMEEQGMEVNSELEAMADDFSAKLEDAETAYKLSVDKFKEAKEAREEDKEAADSLLKESRAELQNAQQLLKEAHALLVDIVKSLKQEGVEEQLEVAEDEVIEMVVEDDDATDAVIIEEDTEIELEEEEGDNNV